MIRFFRTATVLVLLTHPSLCHADDILELDPVENTGDARDESQTGQTNTVFDQRSAHLVHIENTAFQSGLNELLESVPGARVVDTGAYLQQKTFGYRGAAAQDVIVEYLGIPLNSLSDASADLSLIPAQIITAVDIAGTGAGAASGAVGGLVTLHPDTSNSGLKAVISGSTLADHSLYAQGGRTFGSTSIHAASFGDWSPGRFHYIDDQDSRQTREHNASSRTGAQILIRTELPRADIQAFSFFSSLERDEAGLSEYPSLYQYAGQSLWLSLSGLRATLGPFKAGKSWADVELSASHRASRDVYDNPTVLIGRSRMHNAHLENSSILDLKSRFLAGTWSTTAVELGCTPQILDISYESSSLTTQERYVHHTVFGLISERGQFFDDRLRFAISLRTDWHPGDSPLFSPHLGISGSPHESLDLWGSSSMTSRYPTFNERYYKTEFMRGNPDLRPQKGIVNEIGLRYHPAVWFDVTITAFWNLHRELIRYIPISPYLYEARNISNAFARGAEVSFTSKFWLDFHIRGSYHFVDAQTEEGLELPTTSRHQASAELFWDDERWHAGIKAAWRSAMPINLANTIDIPERLRLDASFSFRFYPSWRLTLSLNNLLDDKTSEDALQRPLPGRHAWLALEYAGE